MSIKWRHAQKHKESGLKTWLEILCSEAGQKKTKINEHHDFSYAQLKILHLSESMTSSLTYISRFWGQKVKSVRRKTDQAKNLIEEDQKTSIILLFVWEQFKIRSVSLLLL